MKIAIYMILVTFIVSLGPIEASAAFWSSAPTCSKVPEVNNWLTQTSDAELIKIFKHANMITYEYSYCFLTPLSFLGSSLCGSRDPLNRMASELIKTKTDLMVQNDFLAEIVKYQNAAKEIYNYYKKNDTVPPQEFVSSQKAQLVDEELKSSLDTIITNLEIRNKIPSEYDSDHLVKKAIERDQLGLLITAVQSAMELDRKGITSGWALENIKNRIGLLEPKYKGYFIRRVTNSRAHNLVKYIADNEMSDYSQNISAPAIKPLNMFSNCVN